MDKKLLFIVNPRAGRTKSFAPLFDAVACFSKAGYLVKVFLTEGRGDATRAAAELGVEYTVPEVSQSLIITRLEGRTPVPEREQLESFASHQTSMAIYLSVQRINRVAERLIEGGYPATTPVAVIYKATWPESQTVRGTLADIADKVRDAGIRKTALILVGNFLGDEYHYSRLYAADFSHEYRKA